MKGGDFHSSLPLTGSHEPCEKVEEVGLNVTWLKKADRIGTLLSWRSWEYLGCKSGSYSNAIRWRGKWASMPTVHLTRYSLLNFCTAFKYFVRDPKTSVHLPYSLSFEHVAPLFCAGTTIHSAIKKANLKKSDVLGIIGLAALGHLGVQFVKCMVYADDLFHQNLTVVAIDSCELTTQTDQILNTLLISWSILPRNSECTEWNRDTKEE